MAVGSEDWASSAVMSRLAAACSWGVGFGSMSGRRWVSCFVLAFRTDWGEDGACTWEGFKDYCHPNGFRCILFFRLVVGAVGYRLGRVLSDRDAGWI